MTNDEFKMKLFKMGKVSQLRFSKLARLFAKKFKLNRFNSNNQKSNIQNEVYIYKADKFHENENYIQNTDTKLNDYNY